MNPCNDLLEPTQSLEQLSLGQLYAFPHLYFMQVMKEILSSVRVGNLWA